MSARDVAFSVVRDVFPPQAAPERAAQESLEYRAEKAKLDARDRAFCTNLSFGAIKMRRTLDWYLQRFIGSRSKALPLAISEILRLAIFELQYTGAAEHAVVSEWVNLAKRHGHRGTAGLVNAVLRSFLRDRPAPPRPEDFENEDDYLGTLYSYPTWIVRQWRDVFGSSQLGAMLEGCNAPAQPAVTINRRKQTPEGARSWFAQLGVTARQSELAEDSLLVSDGAIAAVAERDARGEWWLQSETSAMVVDILGPGPRETIADVCSGRGSKALQIAARLGEGEAVLCIDRDARKIATLEQRAATAGVAVAAIAGDATSRMLPQRLDRALIDAPCSGLGALGRHPELRWRKRADDGERLALTQRALLEALAPQLFEGGALVYAVCSTDPRETTEVIDWFMRAHNVGRGLVPARFAQMQTADGSVLVPPGVEGRDGFFVARLERGP